MDLAKSTGLFAVQSATLPLDLGGQSPCPGLRALTAPCPRGEEAVRVAEGFLQPSHHAMVPHPLPITPQACFHT